MRTTIVRWGNSQGIRLPKSFLQNIQLAENDPVDVLLEDDKIIIKKINTAVHKTTQQRLDEFYLERIDQNDAVQGAMQEAAQKEVDWGKPVGNEIW